MQHVRLVMLREIIGWCDGWLESLNCGACRGFLVLLKGMSMMDDGFCTSYFSDADSIIGPRVMMSGTLSKCVVYQRVQVPPPRSHHSFHHASDRKLHHPQLGLIPIYNNPSISLAVYSMVPSPPQAFNGYPCRTLMVTGPCSWRTEVPIKVFAWELPFRIFFHRLSSLQSHPSIRMAAVLCSTVHVGKRTPPPFPRPGAPNQSTAPQTWTDRIALR